MPLFRRVISGVRALFRKTHVEEDLDAELREFLEASVEEQVRAGLSRSEALRRARAEMGSIEAVKDRVRDAGWESVLESVWQDVRYAGRMVRRSPGFATVTIGILALGIGANTAIFSLVNAVMLRTLAVREPSQLVQLLSTYPGEPRIGSFSWNVYEHFRDQNHVFSDLIAVSPSPFQVSRDGLETEMVDGHYVTGNFFPALGVQPAIGRLIGPQDGQLGAADAAVAVMSWSYWQKRFNADPGILGRRIILDGVPAAVIGVAPRTFFGIQVGSAQDVWVPVAMEPLLRRSGQRVSGRLGVGLIGRLKPGVAIGRARAEMQVLDRWRIQEMVRATNNPAWRQATIDVEPAGTGVTTLRDYVGKPLLVLMAIVGLLLLLACANVAGLLLARAAARQREMAVRVSLGAGRLRLVRQVLTESLLLSLAGSLLGVYLAYVGAHALLRVLASGRPIIGFARPFDVRVQLDQHVLVFTTAIAVFTGLLFGLAPALHALMSVPSSLLREMGGAADSRRRRFFGKSLVVAQVALSVVLLSVAGLFVGHLSRLRNVDLGFQRDSVLLVTLNPQGSGYDRDQLSRLYRDVLERLQAIAGVQSATLSGVTPIEGAGASRFVNVEQFREDPDARRYVSLNWVGPRYFETLGTPLLAGRDFTFEDEGRPSVAIVNRAMAQYYFGDRSPIGQYFTFEGHTTRYEIVGVVGDAKYLNLHDQAPRTIYLNAFQEGRGSFSQLALRTTVAPASAAGEVRRTVRDVLKTVNVAKVTTLADQVDASIVPERMLTTLSALLGALGVSLAAIGLYGLLAYTVARRTNEIGVRMALGATGHDVTRMVLTSALGLTGAGLVVGLPIAFWSRRVAASLVENLTTEAAFPIVFAALVMVAAALLAAYVPARRAARVQPMEALRHS